MPLKQTCCGQAAYNNGDFKDSRKIAIQVMDLFENFDDVVIPSGSCAGMIKKHYPALFNKESDLFKRASDFSNRTCGLSCQHAFSWHPEKLNTAMKNRKKYLSQKKPLRINSH